MSEPRNHHVIPQMFLRGFSVTPGSPFLWRYTKTRVYEPGKQHSWFNPALQSTSQVAVERDYFAQITGEELDYSSVEKRLVPFETRFAPSIRRARNLERLSLEDRENIMLCMEMLYKRAHAQRIDRNNFYPERRDKTKAQLDKEFLELERDSSIDPSRLASVKAEIEQIFRERLNKNKPPNEIVNSLLFLDYHQLRSGLGSMHWTWLLRSDQTPFICSDNPVFFHRAAGLGNSDLTFPVGSNVALLLTWHPTHKQYMSASDSLVRRVNRRTVQYAHREAYASINEEWILRILKKAPYPDAEL